MKACNRINYSSAVLFLAAFVLLMASSGFTSVDKNKISDPIFSDYHEFVHEFPEPVSGFSEISDKITYPKIAIKANIEGEILAKTYIDEKGNVKYVEIVKGIGAGCDETVTKAIESTKFKPAIFDGQAVKSQVIIPVWFKLHDHK